MARVRRKVIACAGRNPATSKKPGVSAGLLISIRRTLSSGFIRHGSVVTIGFDIGLVGFGRFRLGAAARPPGELRSKTSRNLFRPRGYPGWGRQPEVKWPAAPSSPTTSNCPASSRAMASTDSNGGTALRSIGEPAAGFMTSLLRKRGWLERIAGSNVAFPGKGSRHGKLSAFHTGEQLLHAGGERYVPAAATAWHPLMFRRIRLVTTRATAIARCFEVTYSGRSPALRGFSRNPKQKARSCDRAFRFNPWNWDPFRQPHPPRLRRRRRLRHRPRRLRRQPRSLPPWRRGAGSWRAGSRFP
jgi:hypothetical protein